MAVPAQTLSFCGVLCESKRIINAHSRHFLALSVLFLLPLSFSLITYPTIYSTLSHSGAALNSRFFLLLSTFDNHSHRSLLLLPLLYSLSLILLSLCAVASITYSTYHGFYGRPVKFLSAIRSLFYSFFPLLSTAIISQAILILISITFLIPLALIVKGVETLGFEIDYNSNYFTGLCIVVSIVLGVLLIHLLVNWSLASVIVVAESKWGVEPLRRSAYLLRGMRSVSLSLLIFFGGFIGLMVWANSDTVLSTSFGSGWRSWAFIFQNVMSSSLLTLFLLHNAASNTVLYMYCKALQGELAFEIAEEFAREYVSLPFDDEKLPHVVTVVQT